MSDRKIITKTDLVVLTGGPGAGKTAVLEMAKKTICEYVTILPEAASIIYGGGFLRLESLSARTCAQTAIYHVQNELEKLVLGEKRWLLGLCDRGTLDGLAYWPLDEAAFWEMNKSSIEKEYAKYKAIIHLRTPNDQYGYNHQNPMRTESASEARQIDDRIAHIWKNHPDYNVIDSSEDFLSKAQKTLDLVSKYRAMCS